MRTAWGSPRTRSRRRCTGIDRCGSRRPEDGAAWTRCLQRWWRTFDDATRTWSDGAAIHPESTGISYGIGLAGDPAGNAFVVWGRHVGARSDMFISRLERSSGSWSAPLTLDTDEAATPRSARIATGDDGTALVVWSEEKDRHSRVLARRFG